MALVLAPEAPVEDWFAEFDSVTERSPGFFVGRAVVLDVSALSPNTAELARLVGELKTRNVRLLGIEGADPACFAEDAELPPLVSGGRAAGLIEVANGTAPEKPAAPAAAPQPSTLLVDSPVRSGQSVMFPEGDVTIIGSVASGAEVVAGGSIHIYGALRGRAIAGTTGNAAARIFCRKMEAELVAIDGLYKTADDMEAQFRSRPVQVWLDGDAMLMTALD